MLQHERGHAPGLDSEDRLHRALALLLGALAGGVLLLREPVPPGEPARGEASSHTRSLDAPSRAALEAAIAELGRWCEARAPRTALDANQRLLALGRSALEAAPGREGAAALVWKNLETLSKPSAPEARPASLPAAGADGDNGDAGGAATLAILLETGLPLDAELPLPSGTASPRQLLALALASPPGSRRDPADPWRLDLLSFAVLAGMAERRAELERETLASLARLERDQRSLTALMGNGQPPAGAREALAKELRQRRADGAGWARELGLAAAVFRAVAVLAQPELERRALRHLAALSFRLELEGDLQQQALARAQTAPERIALRLEGIEALGRLEQTFYGAHLALRREASPGPSPRTASRMLRAAGELLEQLEALKRDGAFAAPGEARPGLEAERLERAAAQALRGLRVARIAS
jgi:hypothetical protein